VSTLILRLMSDFITQFLLTTNFAHGIVLGADKIDSDATPPPRCARSSGRGGDLYRRVGVGTCIPRLISKKKPGGRAALCLQTVEGASYSDLGHQPPAVTARLFASRVFLSDSSANDCRMGSISTPMPKGTSLLRVTAWHST
jgi:hypothetical protein